MKKGAVVKYINTAIVIFLGIAVIGSQLNVVLSSIGVGGLIILIIARIAADPHVTIVNKNIIFLWIIYLIIQIIGSYFSDVPAESFSNVFRRFSLYPVFFATFIFIDNLKDLKRLLMVFFVFSALLSSVEMVRYLIDFFSQSEVKFAEFRLGYSGAAITIGEIKMLIALLIIPLLFIKEKFVFNKAVLILMLIPILLTLYFTNTRNAFLGVFGGMLITGALKSKYFFFSLVACTILFLLFAPLPLKERMVSIVDLHHKSNESKIVTWETGERIVKDRPFLGFGDIDINKIYARYKKPELNGEGEHMHNNYLQIVVMFGFIGFISWAAAMIYIFIWQIKVYMATKKNNVLNALALISLISMVAFNISGLTEWNFGDAKFAVVMWFSIGLGFLALKLNRTNEADLQIQRPT